MLIGPLTKTTNVSLIEKIPVEEIIRGYNDQFQVNIRRHFRDIEFVELYKENESGYKFFYPMDIEGDNLFYQEMQKFDWYYMKWKWEHANCWKYFETGNKMLEIGSGNGDFVERMSSLGFQCFGLELNSEAVEMCQKKGLTVFNETIQEHAEKKEYDAYDLVCSFQVMEHIGNINEVIEASIKCLKKGGKLVISVPNNDSFLGYDRNYLNMPPHHMGLWNKESLLYLTKIFPLEFISCDFEPLQEYHIEYFYKTMREHFARKRSLLNRIRRKVFSLTFPHNLIFFSASMKAFTIQVIYRKI